MASKEEIVRTIEQRQREVEQAASAMPEAAWSNGVYEKGWNAKQLLCHLTEDTGVTRFLIGLASGTYGTGETAAPDVDDWNTLRVAALQDKSVPELLDYLRTNCQRDIAAAEAASDELLSRPVTTPWGAEGPLGDIIVQSITEHGEVHLPDLRSAVG